MSVTRKIIEIDENLCNGCGECVPSCAEGAIQIVDGKARLVADKYCDGLGACLGECPVGALRIVEREADDFDEEAVHAHLAGQTAEAQVSAPAPASHTSGCPGSAMQSFGGGCPGSQARQFAAASPAPASAAAPAESALSHWPVQIRLLSPHAPYFQHAHMLVAADCVPVAYQRFHQDLLAGKSVLVGCPKLDDMGEAVEKFTEIFRANEPASVAVAVMEVPCCQRLPMVVREGLQRAGRTTPVELITIGVRGDLLGRKTLV